MSDDFVDMTGYNREEINGINCRFLQVCGWLPVRPHTVICYLPTVQEVLLVLVWRQRRAGGTADVLSSCRGTVE